MLVPNEWTDLEELRVRKQVPLTELILFRWERFGHRNNPGVVPRFGQAFFVSIVVGLFVAGTYVLVGTFIFDESFMCLIKTIDFFKMLSFLASVFVFVAALEIGSYYQKWKYLADLFNSVIRIEPQPTVGASDYSQREHLAACLAMDVVCMEMWNHRSFRPFLKETIEKAVLVDVKFEESASYCKLSRHHDEIEYDELVRLLGLYIDWTRPDEDKVAALMQRAAKKGSGANEKEG